MAYPTVVGEQIRDAGQTTQYYEFTIASSGTTSSAVELDGGGEIVGIVMPSAFTGSTLTFQASIDGTTYNNIYDSSTSADLSVNVAASKYVRIDPITFCGIKDMKIVSGSTEAAERTIYVVTRTIN